MFDEPIEPAQAWGCLLVLVLNVMIFGVYILMATYFIAWCCTGAQDPLHPLSLRLP